MRKSGDALFRVCPAAFGLQMELGMLDGLDGERRGGSWIAAVKLGANRCEAVKVGELPIHLLALEVQRGHLGVLRERGREGAFDEKGHLMRRVIGLDCAIQTHNLSEIERGARAGHRLVITAIKSSGAISSSSQQSSPLVQSACSYHTPAQTSAVRPSRPSSP